MFNMLVEPEKIIDFSIQNGLPCYRIRWCDSWIPQESLSNSWQHLIDTFWKTQTEQQQQQQVNDANRYLPAITNNKFLPTFSSLLINNSPPNLHGLSEETVETSHQQPLPPVNIQAKELVMPPPAAVMQSVPADYQITTLLESSESNTINFNNKIKPQETVKPLKAKKNPSNPKTRIIRKVKPKTDNSADAAEKQESVVCSECNRDFSRTINPRKRLREHTRRVHLKNGKFQCSHCTKTFVCRQGLRDHEPVHSKERNHQCSYCEQTFLRLSHLYIHTRTHEEEKNFRCEACFVTFNVQSELKDHCDTIHMNTMVDVKCSVCKQNLYSSQSIYSHSLRHSGTRDFKCEKCGMAFKRKQILDQHKRRHESDTTARKSAKCNICLKEFTTKSTLREHVFLVHNSSLDGSDHKCEVCGKCFRNWANYNRHVRLHPKIKEWVTTAKEQEVEILKAYDEKDTAAHQFICNACKNVFISVSQFLDHLRNHQNGSVISSDEDNPDKQQLQEESLDNVTTEMNDEPGHLSCNVCQKTFNQLKYLRSHMDMHGTLELKCDICFMMFKRRDTLRIHKKRHLVRNETAENFAGKDGEIYNSRKELRAKIGKADKDGKVTCPYCEKVFNKRKLLLAHIVLHGNIFFTCETCGKSYKQRSCLNKHKRVHLTKFPMAKRGRPKKVPVIDTGSITDPENKDDGDKEYISTSKSFSCLTCCKKFRSYKSLKNHMQTHASSSKSCDDCGKVYSRRDALSRHVRVTHGKSLSDEITEEPPECSVSAENTFRILEPINNGTEEGPNIKDLSLKSIPLEISADTAEITFSKVSELSAGSIQKLLDNPVDSIVIDNMDRSANSANQDIEVVTKENARDINNEQTSDDNLLENNLTSDQTITFNTNHLALDFSEVISTSVSTTAYGAP